MKKIAIFIAFITSLLVLLCGAFFVVLQTSYAAKTFNLLAQQQQWPLRVEKLDYQFPYHIIANGITTSGNEIRYIQQAQLWISPDSWSAHKLIIDSLLLDGMRIHKGKPNIALPDSVTLRQLAMSNVDYASEGITARGIHLQVKNPRWLSSEQLIPYGTIQISADQIYWQGEAMDNLLLDASYKPNDSTLYGISFNWRGAKISGQAEQYQQSWSLVNMTIDQLHLPATQLTQIAAKPWQEWGIKVNHINSLDIVNSDLALSQDLNLAGVDLSVENLTLPLTLWQQDEGVISLHADNILWQGQNFTDVRFNAGLNTNHIDLKELFCRFQQGSFQLKGELTPQDARLDKLQINRIKWTKQKDGEANWLKAINTWYQNISVKELSVVNSQYIQLYQPPFWQLSGVNVDGDNIVVKHQGTLGLWQGNLTASANNISYQDVVSSQPILEMSAQEGHWSISRLFAPLEKGYIEGHGTLDLAELSKPWSLELYSTGLPASLLDHWSPLPFTLRGALELNADMHGLAGDKKMLAYSLSGEASATLSDGQIDYQQQSWAMNMDPLTLSAKRGHLKISPVHLSGADVKGSVTGNTDLAASTHKGIGYQVTLGCEHLHGDMLSGEFAAQLCPTADGNGGDTSDDAGKAAANTSAK